MSHDQAQQKIAQLEQQLMRERNARKKAEEVLRQKAQELFQSNERLHNLSDRLQFALDASRKTVWEYVIAEDNFYQLDGFQNGDGIIDLAANYQDVLKAYHFDEKEIAAKQWNMLTEDEISQIDFIARRYSPQHKSFRWTHVQAKKMYAKGRKTQAISIVGMFEDVHELHVSRMAHELVVKNFKYTKVPGFMCDFANEYTMLSDSFCKLLGLNEGEADQSLIANAIPLGQIKQHLHAATPSFEASVSTPQGEQNLLFKFSPLEQPELSDGSLQYAVGFILPVK